MEKSKHSLTPNLVLSHHALARAQFSEATRLFLTDCRFRNLTAMTIRGYHDYLQALHRDLQRWNLTLATLQPADLTHRMITEMLDQGFAANTVNGRIRTYQQFFKFLYLEGITENNVAENLKPIRSERLMTHTFTEEQVQEILRQPDRNTFTGLRDYAMMMVLLGTGVRVMELTHMKLSDLDFDDQTIRILAGKGRKFRKVPIQQTCIQSIKEYLLQRGEHDFDALWVTVFNKPFARCGIIDMISRYCKKAEIQGVQGSSHTFRHSMAKFFLMNGGDIFTLQSILGHTSLEMTRYYVELFDNDIHLKHQKFSPVENLYFEMESTIESEEI